ncbi:MULTISPECIES: stage V sporulation protein S [Bacillus]|uniref:stage V sporulation protein S n=1 Tax=Bacillus TaxID=1386 RepID=UPI000B4BB4DC|nr:stage V sporulation protein S [Bacillus cereus]
MTNLRVKKETNYKSLADVISFKMREENVIHIDGIGERPVYIAIKAIAIARGTLASRGINITATPSFGEAVIDGNERTFMRLTIEKVEK